MTQKILMEPTNMAIEANKELPVITSAAQLDAPSTVMAAAQQQQLTSMNSALPRR